MNNFYLIYGSNYSIIKREIEKIIKNYNDVTYYDLSENKIDKVIDDASVISMFGDKKVLIGENALFLTGSKDKVDHDLDYLEKYINSDNLNIVILTVNVEKLDERKKIVKLLKQKVNVIHKEEIQDKNLSNFIIEEFKNLGYKIDYKTANYFVDFVGKNIDIIISEIKKMTNYKEDDKIILIEDINNISSRAFNDNVFDLSDAIMKKDYKKIFDCYNDLVTLKEEPVKIIALIASQFTFVYQAKLLRNDGYSNSDIASLLSVHPYRVKLALENNYNVQELKEKINLLHTLDYEIKSGKVDKNLGLERFLYNM